MLAFHDFFFLLCFFILALQQTKQALYCFCVVGNLVGSWAGAKGFFPMNVHMRKVFPGNQISVWATSLSWRWLLCIGCEGGNVPPTLYL